LTPGRIKPHGKEWKQAMFKCGVVPERCHNVRIVADTFVCDCKEYHFGKSNSTKVKIGMMKGNMTCPNCKSKIRIKESEKA